MDAEVHAAGMCSQWVPVMKGLGGHEVVAPRGFFTRQWPIVVFHSQYSSPLLFCS